MRFSQQLLSILILANLCTVAIATPPVTAAVFTPDGEHVVSGSQAGVVILNWPELRAVDNLQVDLEHVHDLQFSPNGKQLLVAGGSPGEAGIVEIWNWPARDRVKRIEVAADLVYRAAWSPEGSEFATASADGTCPIFDAASGRERVRYAGHSRAVLAIAYLPGGKSIVSAGVDQTLQVWTRATGERSRALDNHLAAINDLALRPTMDDKALPVVASVSDDRTVRLWQPTIGRLMRFARLDSPPRAIAWSNDGAHMIVGCNDGSLYSIDAETLAMQKSSQRFRGRIQVVVSAMDGSWLVGGEDGQLQRFTKFGAD